MLHIKDILNLFVLTTLVCPTSDAKLMTAEQMNLGKFSCGMTSPFKPDIDYKTYMLNHNYTVYKRLEWLDLQSDKKMRFAFTNQGYPFNYIDMPTGYMRGASVDLVREVCDSVHACCEMIGVPADYCFNTTYFPGSSPALDSGDVDFCVDMVDDDEKKMSYKITWRDYWKSKVGSKLKLMVRKNAPILAEWWDEALYNYACNNWANYRKWCKQDKTRKGICPAKKRICLVKRVKKIKLSKEERKAARKLAKQAAKKQNNAEN